MEDIIEVRLSIEALKKKDPKSSNIVINFIRSLLPVAGVNKKLLTEKKNDKVEVAVDIMELEEDDVEKRELNDEKEEVEEVGSNEDAEIENDYEDEEEEINSTIEDDEEWGEKAVTKDSSLEKQDVANLSNSFLDDLDNSSLEFEHKDDPRTSGVSAEIKERYKNEYNKDCVYSYGYNTTFIAVSKDAGIKHKAQMLKGKNGEALRSGGEIIWAKSTCKLCFKVFKVGEEIGKVIIAEGPPGDDDRNVGRKVYVCGEHFWASADPGRKPSRLSTLAMKIGKEASTSKDGVTKDQTKVNKDEVTKDSAKISKDMVTREKISKDVVTKDPTKISKDTVTKEKINKDAVTKVPAKEKEVVTKDLAKADMGVITMDRVMAGKNVDTGNIAPRKAHTLSDSSDEGDIGGSPLLNKGGSNILRNIGSGYKEKERIILAPDTLKVVPDSDDDDAIKKADKKEENTTDDEDYIPPTPAINPVLKRTNIKAEHRELKRRNKLSLNKSRLAEGSKNWGERFKDFENMEKMGAEMSDMERAGVHKDVEKSDEKKDVETEILAKPLFDQNM